MRKETYRVVKGKPERTLREPVNWLFCIYLPEIQMSIEVGQAQQISETYLPFWFLRLENGVNTLLTA